MFAGTRPTFKSVAEITFHNPVEVGDLLRLYSKVLLTAKDFQSQKVCPHYIWPLCFAVNITLLHAFRG